MENPPESHRDTLYDRASDSREKVIQIRSFEIRIMKANETIALHFFTRGRGHLALERYDLARTNVVRNVYLEPLSWRTRELRALSRIARGVKGEHMKLDCLEGNGLNVYELVRSVVMSFD